MNILLIQLKRIGDLILTTPAIAALRERFPKATLTLGSNVGHARRTTRQKKVQPLLVMAKNRSSVPEQYVTVREEMFFVVTERTASGAQQSWQVHMWQVSLQPQSKPVQKPRKI